MYLKKIFTNVIAPDLETGVFNFNTNSFVMSSFRNFTSLFRGSFVADVTKDVVLGGVGVAVESISQEQPDIIVGSSMGGAIALEAMCRGELAAPALLLAPALGRLLKHESIEDWCHRFRNQNNAHSILVVHGVKDDVVDISHSRKLCELIGADLIEVEEGDHSLNDYLLDGYSRSGGAAQCNMLLPLVKQLLSISDKTS